MPVCLYIRGAPGTGKHTVARILERDLGWPMLWVHQFDAVYKAIGEYKVPELTDRLIEATADHLARQGNSFLIVRPSRGIAGLDRLWKRNSSHWFQYTITPVRLTAPYAVLAQRVTRRSYESPCRITTREGLDEYLGARPEESYPGEHVIDTEKLSPEQVAGRIKELLP